jgi:Ca2+-binding EF-hand superfamily protein
MRKQETVLWKAFKSFDVDGSGAISSSELHQVLNQESVGKIMKKTVDELEALVIEVDLDGDGEIDFDEFLQMMRAEKTHIG